MESTAAVGDFLTANPVFAVAVFGLLALVILMRLQRQ
jgi:hypothetical protein